eukprot:2048246-Rhodomonas_salina.1
MLSNGLQRQVCFGGAVQKGPSAMITARVAHKMVLAATSVARPDGQKTILKPETCGDRSCLAAKGPAFRGSFVPGSAWVRCVG